MSVHFSQDVDSGLVYLTRHLCSRRTGTGTRDTVVFFFLQQLIITNLVQLQLGMHYLDWALPPASCQQLIGASRAKASGQTAGLACDAHKENVLERVPLQLRSSWPLNVILRNGKYVFGSALECVVLHWDVFYHSTCSRQLYLMKWRLDGNTE